MSDYLSQWDMPFNRQRTGHALCSCSGSGITLKQTSGRTSQISLSKAIEQGYTKEMLADTLKDQFNDIQIEELAGALQHQETEPKNGFPGDFACKGFRVWRKEIRNGSSSG